MQPTFSKGLKTLALAATALIIPLNAQAESVSAEEAAVIKALDDALPGRLIHNPLDMGWKTRGNDLKSKVVKAEALNTGQAIRVQVKKRQPKPWDSVISVDLPEGVQKGDELQVYYWVRTSKAAKGKETADVDLFLGRNVEPYDNIISQRLTPSETWEMKSLKGTAASDMSEGELKLEYQLGRNSQAVEIGPVYISVLN